MSYQLASRDSRTPAADAQGAAEGFGFQAVVGNSPALLDAVALSRKVAAWRLSLVLVVGETGTGKELFARGIHYAGPSRGEPFVPVNCAAIPEALLESELFGHERGAFTDARFTKRGLLEVAGTGTLFLDEIAELPPKLQPKLLRVLEERKVRRLGGVEEIPVRCRIIAATNESLEEAVAGGAFREDLFYRLNVFRIQIPPLAQRGDDIETLARHFLGLVAQEQGLEPKELTRGALVLLLDHAWPGNVRELKNVMERAALLAEGPEVREEHLTIQRRDSSPASTRPDPSVRSIEIPPGGKTLDAVEAELFRHTLELAGGNRSVAAGMLGISRATVHRKIRAYGIDVAPYEGSER